MQLHGRQLTLILVTMLFPGFTWCAGPRWHMATEAAGDATLGCRWRRCVAVVPVMPRVEDERVRLQLKFEKGMPYYAEMTTETRQTMTVMGQEVVQTQTQSFYLQITPLGWSEQGLGVMRMKIIGAKMKIDIGGVIICSDSTQDRLGAEPLASFFAKLVNAEFKLAIDARDGKVHKIDGLEKLIKELGVTSPHMEPLLKNIISNDALKQMVAPVFAFIPVESVRPGDVWKRTHTLDLGPIGSYQTVTVYRYDRMAENLVRIGVRSKLHYEAPTEKAGLPFQIKQAALASTDGGGEITFDLAKGRLVESTLRQTIAGTLTLEVGGVVAPVALDQRQTMRIRVTERNPLTRRD